MNEKGRNAAELMTGLLVAAVLLAVFLVACDTKSPVGPGSVTLPTTTTSTVSPQPAGVTLTATFTVSPTVAMVGQTVTVNGSASTAAAGRRLVAHDWDFGNGVTKSGVTASQDFAAPGTYPVVLTVTDDAGQKATATQTLTVVQPGATTTTVPPPTAVVHYVATPTVPEVPADLTLLFQLLSTGSSFLSRLSIIRPMADPTYGVSGSWVSANKQITGGIKGQFTGVLTPTVNGQFTGSLTATVQGGCTTERSFAGPLGQALSLAAGTITGPACSPNPWTYGDFNMSQTTAPPPTSTSTSSTTSTSTSTSSTTSTSTSTTSTTTSTTSTTTSIPIPADLIPLAPAGSTFCRFDANDNLVITVGNQGNGAAGASQTSASETHTGGGGTGTASTAALVSGSAVEVMIPGFTACRSGCTLSITVDSRNEVTESDETNNTVTDISCGVITPPK